jgi:hypothetical protein
MTVNGTTVLQPVIYKNIPFYGNIWFWLTIMVIVFAGIWLIYRLIIDRLRNRIVLRFHMPNGDVEHHIRREYPGSKFTVQGHEQTVEGKNQLIEYDFKTECIEKGRWGQYIDWDYGIREPINHKERIVKRSEHFQLFKMLSALTNSEMLINLLLAKEWKEFVKMMLIFIIIVAGLTLIASILMPIVMKPNIPIQNCLGYNNLTADFIRRSVMNQPLFQPLP